MLNQEKSNQPQQDTCFHLPCHSGGGEQLLKAAPTFPVWGFGLFAKAAQPALL